MIYPYILIAIILVLATFSTIWWFKFRPKKVEEQADVLIAVESISRSKKIIKVAREQPIVSRADFVPDMEVCAVSKLVEQTPTSICEKVYMLADSGHSIKEIAPIIGVSSGEVDLLLHIRQLKACR